MKRLQMILAAVLLCVAGCQSHGLKQIYAYPYFEATVDDLPPVDDIKAIAITHTYPLFMGEIWALLGDRRAVEDILGHDMYAKVVIDDRQWVERLMTHLKNAERCQTLGAGWERMRMVFITDSKGYVMAISGGDNSIYGVGFLSTQLYWDFNRLEGIEEEINRRKRGNF